MKFSELCIFFPNNNFPFIFFYLSAWIKCLIRINSCPVGCLCRIHRLHLFCGIRPTTKECPVYDKKQSDSEASVDVEIWGMQSSPSFPSLLDPLWPRVMAPDRVLSMGQIKLNCVITLNWIVWNYLFFNI